MKICWDNLEHFYLTKKGNLRKGKNIYDDSVCELCGEEFLRIRCTKDNFCGRSCANKGRNHPLFGIMGSKHPNWNPELTDEERLVGRSTTKDYYWKKLIKERDDYTCQCCLIRGGDMVSHHKFSYHSYPELRHDIENGITLCKLCHTKFHKEFGYKNNTKKQLYYWLLKRRKYGSK